ncbi:PTS sugar transporter subunit IIC [Vagococcus lutrae]|nr:PTS sugar transporter subunit IIC [Vagococcus lutrae]MDT2812485.1 PTS sugar transporter subunit IIC [Vagococcus lutrae]MDT2842713.1 PTS sugar transporter subunit IIC [Vagococcus lutrae]MDT2844306.1 PTS sugar transporter subunit IIC [Vagococcus lutrae]WCG06020.1 PTS sugar transporter subunit IIC [Vagococcus lutrae]
MLPPMAKLAEQKHLRAVRDGIISTMPLIMIGSFFVLLVNFPIPAWTNLIQPYVPSIMLPYRITVGLMALYASYGMGYSLAKSYDLDGISGGSLSLGTFLMTMTPVIGKAVEGDAELGWVLPMNFLGGGGMFTAILTMILAVEILRFCKEKNVTIRLPEQVPDSVARSFEAIIPGMISLTLIWFVSHILKFNINEAIMKIFNPVVDIAGNTYLGVLIPVLLICLLWAAGVHGVSVIGSIVRPLWLVLLEQNITEVANGGVAQNIGTEGFFDLFIWIGGSGGTLALCILFMMSKSAYMKQIGRLSLIPGIFNINEPIMFGAPIVLNPILAIPFVISPVVTTTITYIAMKFDFVAKVSVVTPFAIPAPIKAYLSTNGDWRAIILVLINFAVYFAIYYPFVKAYDKKMYAEELSQEAI